LHLDWLFPAAAGLDRFTNALISAAAADIALHRRINVGIGRLRIFFEQRGGAHDLSALTVAALRDVRLPPRLLQGMRGALAKTFNRYDILAANGFHRPLATARGRAIQMNHASTA